MSYYGDRPDGDEAREARFFALDDLPATIPDCVVPMLRELAEEI